MIDLIRARFGNGQAGRLLAGLLALLMLVFFTTMMVGQFIGGAQIFSKAADVSYAWGLVMFGAVTVLYTAFGGFRAVAITDTVCLLALLMLVFFTTMMVGQFIGGAQIFSKAADVSYAWGLVMFGAVTVLYTAFGGFRAVAITDTVCAILMVVGMGALGMEILEEGGGLASVMANVAAVAPRGSGSEGTLLMPTSGGALGIPLLLSAWVLVGFGTLGLPQSAVRCMSYRRSGDLHQAMILGNPTVTFCLGLGGLWYLRVAAVGCTLHELPP